MSIRQKFSESDDEKLLNLVEEHGEDNWKLISKCMGNKTQRQCRERYRNYVNPDINKSPWTVEEEELLLKKHEELGSKWSQLKKYFYKRTDVNIKNHYVGMINRQKILSRSQSRSCAGKSETKRSEKVSTSDETNVEENLEYFLDLSKLSEFDLQMLLTSNDFSFDFDPSFFPEAH